MASYLLFLHPCMPSSFYVCLAYANGEECTDAVALLATATGLQYLKQCGIQISSHYAAAHTKRVYIFKKDSTQLRLAAILQQNKTMQ